MILKANNIDYFLLSLFCLENSNTEKVKSSYSAFQTASSQKREGE